MHWSAQHVPAEQRVLVTRTLHRDGEPDLVFPHQERYLTTDQLDDMATRAGLQLEERHGDWKGRAFTGRGNHVSTYVSSWHASRPQADPEELRRTPPAAGRPTEGQIRPSNRDCLTCSVRSDLEGNEV